MELCFRSFIELRAGAPRTNRPIISGEKGGSFFQRFFCDQKKFSAGEYELGRGFKVHCQMLDEA